jgi:hypothetical protein
MPFHPRWREYVQRFAFSTRTKEGTAMTNIKVMLLSIVAGSALAGAGVAMSPFAAFAASTTTAPGNSSSAAASVACEPSGGSWTDCSVTLSKGLPDDSEVAVALPSNDGQMSYCDDTSLDADGNGNPNCGLSAGNAAVFYCDDGCGAGTQFDLSVLDGAPSGSGLAADMTISSGSQPVSSGG